MKKFIMLLLLFNSIAHALSKSSDEEIVTNRNRQFSFALESNPSTGYSWQLNGSSYDTSMIKKVSEKYSAPASIRPMVGAPGKQTFTFKALKPGSASIILQYKRPWEPQAAKTYKVDVIIK